MAKCKTCDKTAPFLSELCDDCSFEAMTRKSPTTPKLESHAMDAALRAPSPSQSSPSPDSGTIAFGTFIGVIVGAIAGYLFRPAIPLIGEQMPFGAVMTRGASLQGMDRLLVGVAQQSFNYVVMAALIGGAIGGFVGYLRKEQSAMPAQPADSPVPLDPTQRPSPTVVDSTPITVQLGDTRETVLASLGAPRKIVDLGPKTLFVYADLKITFGDGKVTDVQ